MLVMSYLPRLTSQPHRPDLRDQANQLGLASPLEDAT